MVSVNVPLTKSRGCAEDRKQSMEEGSIHFNSVSEETKSNSASIT